MTVIFMSKTTFNIVQYDNVRGLLFDKDTGTYTVQYGESDTATYLKANWLVSIIFN